MPTQLDSRQIKKRIALLKLGAPAASTLESILDKINVEFDAPLRMAASAIPDAVLNFSSSLLAAADGANKVVSPVKKQIFASLTNPTINFQTQAVSNAADFDVAWGTATLGQFRYAAFTLIGSGKIKVLFSGEFASEAALAAAVNPGSLFVSGGSPIGYVTLQATNASPAAYKTAGSATDIIENAKIYRPAASGGGSATGGSGAGGGELVDLLYQAAIRDSFTDIPDGTTTVDISAGFTDAALHDVANELFRLAYDASKTVSATGTAVTMSSAPTFTVKAGDIINIPGVDSPKKITAVTNQTTYTIESAWTVDPSSAACVISQAVHTVDLNAFTNGGLGLAASSQFTGNIDDVLIAYGDSDASGDIIPDFGTTADMGFSVSADGTAWSEAKIRPDSLSELLTAASTPTASTQFKIRFFANKTTGSGFVNLLAYKAFFHKQTGETVGAQLLSAFARPTSSIEQNCTHGVSGGKSRFQFTWAYPRGANDGEASGSMLQVYANGQRVPRFVSGVTDPAQAYFTEISDTVIEMDIDYSAAGIDFQFRVESTIIDSNTQNTTRISEIENIVSQISNTQIVASFLTAFNGTPGAGQFRSDIANRTSIVDPGANLMSSIGINRMMSHDLAIAPNEIGPAGQLVYKFSNDKFDHIRFVGSWSLIQNDQGRSASTITVDDYMEVVFYGTGLNILVYQGSGTGDFRTSIDGGAESANQYTANSTVLDARNYGKNTIVNIASGLTEGVHTAKIRVGATSSNGLRVFGLEVLNQSSAIKVGSGSAIKGVNKNILGVLSSVSYNSDFESGTLGIRGANVVLYIKEDGTIGKALTPTNASAAYLSSSDHTNEEIIRSYGFREFGASRSDDFSLDFGAGTRSFTLDDGTTTLVALNGQSVIVTNALNVNTSNDYITLTFVGTGLDIDWATDATTRAFDVYVDSSLQGTITKTGSSPREIAKICSGLPYGTHTVRFLRTVAAASPGIFNFIVYGPKKPSIPENAVELCQYYLVADYDGTTVTGTTIITNLQTPNGSILKSPSREYAYVGANWTINQDTNLPGGHYVGTATNNGQTMTYTFFGTGACIHMYGSSGGTYDFSVTIDGALNATLTGRSNITNLGGGSYRMATGSQLPGRLDISNLSLGLHTIIIQRTAGAGNFQVAGFFIITPVHSPAFNLPINLQNKLTVGNDSLADSRQWNEKDVSDENMSQVSMAQALISSPSTTSTTSIPCPDMSTVVYSKGSRFKISFTSTVRNTVAGNSCRFVLVIDGVTLPETEILIQPGSANFDQGAVINHNMYLSKGFHKVDIFWRTSAGTMSSSSNLRVLLVEEMK